MRITLLEIGLFMIAHLTTDMSWVVELRGPMLTSFFEIFPLPPLPRNRQAKLVVSTGGMLTTIALRYSIKLIPAHSLLPYTKPLAFACLAIYVFYIWPKAIKICCLRDFRPSFP